MADADFGYAARLQKPVHKPWICLGKEPQDVCESPKPLSTSSFIDLKLLSGPVVEPQLLWAEQWMFDDGQVQGNP